MFLSYIKLRLLSRVTCLLLLAQLTWSSCCGHLWICRNILSSTEGLPCTGLQNLSGLNIDMSADEDITSDKEEKRMVELEDSKVQARSRKRKLSSDWPTHRSKKDCQVEMRDCTLAFDLTVISKWNKKKTRLASGRSPARWVWYEVVMMSFLLTCLYGSGSLHSLTN